MSLQNIKLGRSSRNRNKRGHSKPSAFRKSIKNQTNRKRRRLSTEEIPIINRHNGYG